jgi:hypothetical protein
MRVYIVRLCKEVLGIRFYPSAQHIYNVYSSAVDRVEFIEKELQKEGYEKYKEINECSNNKEGIHATFEVSWTKFPFLTEKVSIETVQIAK